MVHCMRGAYEQDVQALMSDLRILRLSASVTFGPSDVSSPLASAWALAFFAWGVGSLSADPCMPGLSPLQPSSL